MPTPLPLPSYFLHRGRRLAYREVGQGDRTIVLTHGLLMDSLMFTALASTLAEAGYRVILADMLGHGKSDMPRDMASYSMPQFGESVIGLLDHLGVEQAVVGGTSLGANVSLEAAVLAPERVRALVVEMPVLENGIAGAGVAFVPLAALLRVQMPGMRMLASIARRIPRSLLWLDIGLDLLRRDPQASLAVLDGITFNRIAPPASERRGLRLPTLIVGHGSDPIHPFTDADMLNAELPTSRLVEARSIAEWRIAPKRLDAELVRFLDEVWSRPQLHLVAS